MTRVHQGPSDIYQIIGVTREAQHSQRNICLRRAPADEQLGAGLVLSLESAPVMHQPLSVAVSGLKASVGPSDTHQTISERQGSDYPRHKGDPIAARQRELLVRADNARPFDIPLRPGLTIQAEIQNSAHPELPEIEELEELMIEYRRGLAGVVIEAHMKRPNGINLRWIQNNEVSTHASVHDGHPVMVQMHQSNSSINNDNPVQLQDSLAEDDLPSNGMSNGMDKFTSSVNTQTLVQSQDLLAELPSSPVASTGIV
ncbi:hypothetical protein GH714_032383 [Hevea brasiliensis]|uniref:Uncharacterized protein n=1 Tax=Hevea brasiliensis TaxID=3981 RepID=A0A6A6L4R0_HEVBR|nr:hypothetical protein GH714_032383 [Hevea brasiliensis]